MVEGERPRSLLHADGVQKSYGERVLTIALRGVDLQLSRGEFCALTGPSGCGKTTLLNMIGLLDRPTSGRILIDGVDTGPLDDGSRTRLRGETLGFIFQFHHLLNAFTAIENVMLPLMARHGRMRRWMRKRAEDLLDQVDLTDRMDYPASDLSGGQQQRVAVARALAMDPALVLADEPTGNLDTEAGDRVMQTLLRIRRERGTAFLIVTHNAEISERCDRIIHMVDGRIHSDTKPA